MRIAPLPWLAAMMLAVTANAASAQTKSAKPAPAKPAQAGSQPAGSPMLVMESKDWKVVTATNGKSKVCFAMTRPTKMEPASLKHGDVIFFVSSRPAENVRNEPSLQFGYPLKEGQPVTVDIDGRKYKFFTRGDGAWFEQSNEYAAFLEALKKGKKMSVAAASARGNPTAYAFSLAGVTGAIEGATKECGK